MKTTEKIRRMVDLKEQIKYNTCKKEKLDKKLSRQRKEMERVFNSIPDKDVQLYMEKLSKLMSGV